MVIDKPAKCPILLVVLLLLLGSNRSCASRSDSSKQSMSCWLRVVVGAEEKRSSGSAECDDEGDARQANAEL
jgi:hypothetical protein